MSESGPLYKVPLSSSHGMSNISLTLFAHAKAFVKLIIRLASLISSTKIWDM